MQQCRPREADPRARGRPGIPATKCRPLRAPPLCPLPLPPAPSPLLLAPPSWPPPGSLLPPPGPLLPPASAPPSSILLRAPIRSIYPAERLSCLVSAQKRAQETYCIYIIWSGPTDRAKTMMEGISKEFLFFWNEPSAGAAR